VVARIFEPDSKLATTRSWHLTTLPALLEVDDADEDDLYAALDWLLVRQDRIEKKMAARHLNEDGIALYDLSSSYFEPPVHWPRSATTATARKGSCRSTTAC